jgi:hypothetical protein
VSHDQTDEAVQASGRTQNSSRQAILLSLRWPVALVAMGLIALIGYIWTVRSTKEVGAQLGRIAEQFHSGTITHRFLAAIPELSSAGTGLLELATAQMTETFSRSEEKRIFWDWIYLGETVTEIRVPVTYRYHVRLADPWRLEISGQTCVVHAPSLRPSLPPAIHTEKMEKKTERGWLGSDADQQMTDLEKSITPTLEAYARDKHHLDFVREECRKTLAEFVKRWLLKEDFWRSDRFHTIVVLFEEEGSVPPERARPSLQLER